MTTGSTTGDRRSGRPLPGRARRRAKALGAVAALAVASLLIGGPAALAAANPRTATATRTTVPVAASSRTIERPRSAAVANAEALGARALARLRFDWRTELPGWEIVFLPSRADAYGVTFRIDRRIEIYVRADRNVDAIAHDVAHELGHAYDLERNDDEARLRYLRLRNLPESTEWFTCDGCADLEVGAGDFAETFALWAAPAYRFYSALGSVPTTTQVRRIATQVFGSGPAR